MGKNLVFLALLGLGFGLQYVAQQKIAQWEGAYIAPPTVQHSKWNMQITQAMSFGQWPAVVEWLWMRALQDIELTHVSEGEHANAFFDLDLATDLDPAFFTVYFFGSLLLTVVRDDNEGARLLLEKANTFRVMRKEEEINPDQSTYGPRIGYYGPAFWNEFWKEEWRVPQMLGYLYLFEFNDMDQSTEYFRQASIFDNAPAYLKRLDNQLSSDEGRYRLALRYLNRAQNEADNPLIKESLKEKEMHLQVEFQLYLIERDFRDFLNAVPEYRKKLQLSAEMIGKYWESFRRKASIPQQDFLGGRIYIDDKGTVKTTSKIKKVLKN